MIKLTEIDLKLIRKIERANSTNYNVVEIRGEYYIDIDDLMTCLDDTQYDREYAEDRLVEVANEYGSHIYENSNSLQIHTIEELNKLRQENEKLKQKLEAIQNTLNEDDYDKLAMEGIEI